MLTRWECVSAFAKDFIDALRQKILHDKIKAEAERNKGEVQVDTVDASEVSDGD